MGATLDSLMIEEGESYLYTAEYRIFLETHLHYLRRHVATQTVPLDPELVYKNLGDWNGLLYEMGQPLSNHWTILRVSGERDATHLTMDHTQIRVPDPLVMARLIQMYRTTIGRV